MRSPFAPAVAVPDLHLIYGLFDAHRSRVPVLAIAARISSAEIGTGYFQETHPDQLFRECSHYCELVSHPAQLPAVLEAAMRTAIGRRGVAVVVIPGDVALQRISATASVGPAIVIDALRVTPDERDLERLAELLNAGRRVTLLRGRGCAGAHEPLMRLADTPDPPIRTPFYPTAISPVESGLHAPASRADRLREFAENTTLSVPSA